MSNNSDSLDNLFLKKACAGCGKVIYFSAIKPLNTYAYQLQMVETGVVHHKVFCSWTCYVKAKRAWCEERLSKMKQPKQLHPCEAWLRSMTPVSENYDEDETPDNSKPREKLQAKTSQKDFVKKYYKLVDRKRSQGFTWREIADMLGNIVTSDCVRRNYELLKKEEEQ